MSATPWTPGPWIVRVAGPNDYPYAITAPHVPWDKKGAIRDITRWAAISMPSSAEGQANARLIAGAPEMAEALEALIQLVPRPTSTVDQLAEDQDAEHPEVVAARTLRSRIRGDAT